MLLEVYIKWKDNREIVTYSTCTTRRAEARRTFRHCRSSRSRVQRTLTALGSLSKASSLPWPIFSRTSIKKPRCMTWNNLRHSHKSRRYRGGAGLVCLYDTKVFLSASLLKIAAANNKPKCRCYCVCSSCKA